MSNPLALFRKHQKILLVAFGVALMVAFTVGSIVSQWLGTSAVTANNPVVVKMKSGDLHENDLRNLRAARIQLGRFMRAVNTVAQEKGATPRQSLGIPARHDEDHLVQTAILASRAQAMGIQISDDAIIQFLDLYSQGTLTTNEYARILQNVTQRQMPQNQFFSAMRRELLSLRFLSLFDRGLLPPTPATAWDYFQRLHRSISFEAVPFEVSDFLDQVDEPTEVAINETYAEGKDRFPLPFSKEPGFKRMKKVAVQYAKADLSDFMDQAKAEVTDAQVKAYYEANRDEFRNLTLPPLDSGTTGAADDQFPDLSQPATTSDADDPTPDRDDVPSEDESLDLNPSEQSESSDPASSDETLDDIQNTNEPNADQSQRDLRTLTLPTSAQSDDDASENETTVDGDDTPQVDTETLDDAQDAAADTETTAEADDTEVVQPDDESVPAAESGVADPLEGLLDESPAESNDDPLADLPDAAGPTTEVQPEFKPLEEVAEDIRTTLASPQARAAMEAAQNTVRSRMKSFYTSYRNWYLSPARDTTPAPTPPDLRPLVAEHGLTFGSVPMVNAFEMAKTDPVTKEPLYEISRAYDTTPTYVPFYQSVFDDNLRLFEARSIRGQVLDTEYLYWKVEESAERVPELDEVREEVVRAIKQAAALPLAQQAAQKAAEQIKASGQRPSDVYRNDPNRCFMCRQNITRNTSRGRCLIVPCWTHWA